ncbi:MAG: hypothetical protein H6Q69_132 [Firmicutes bacterium]|nr:hypothetical protein [Bacillota bacterium]MBP2657100.1 hypothetical protein [Bacillota bacterium]
MRRIVEVNVSAEYLVTIHFDNAHSVTIDMKKKLQTARFSELRDEKVFNAAKTDGKSVHWPGGISIVTSEIMEIVTK